jgi:beta-lactamase superfamily II metal-dependent hydrolase
MFQITANEKRAAIGRSNMRCMTTLIARCLVWVLPCVVALPAIAADAPPARGKLVMTVLEIPDIQRGAGLAIILQLPSGKTVLYDTGSGYPDRSSPDGWASQSNAGRDLILPFLQKAGIKEIDTCFISHAHFDHFGGLMWLADNFPIKRLVDSGYHFPGQAAAAYTGELGAYDQVRDAFKKRGAYLEAHTGDQIKLDDDVSVEVLAPPKEFFTQAYAELRTKTDPPAHYLVNANSLGLRLTHGKVVFLLPGDIQAEDQVRSLLPSLPAEKFKCDVLVAPGHGLHAPKEFAAASKPAVTFCSVFPRYAKGLVARKIFAEVGSKVYVTGLHGRLTATSDGTNYTIDIERPNGAPAWRAQAAAYLKALERPDGGYGWPDQDHSHLTPTWAAIGALRLLGEPAAPTPQRISFIRENHPQHAKKPERALHQFDLEQIQSLQWLGSQPGETFVALAKEWTEPVDYMARYEVHAYPPFQQEVACLLSRELLKLPTDLPAYAKYIESRRRENGSYNNTLPADDQSDGYVINTLWAIRGLQAMHRPIERREQLVEWLRACQRQDGSFSPSPNATIGGKSNDVVFAWAALESLRLLQAKPAAPQAALKYLGSLRNADGGFGDRPNWPSNSLATYYAISSLAALAESYADLPTPPGPPDSEPLPAGMKLFTAQIEAPGAGSPADAVTLA